MSEYNHETTFTVCLRISPAGRKIFSVKFVGWGFTTKLKLPTS